MMTRLNGHKQFSTIHTKNPHHQLQTDIKLRVHPFCKIKRLTYRTKNVVIKFIDSNFLANNSF